METSVLRYILLLVFIIIGAIALFFVFKHPVIPPNPPHIEIEKERASVDSIILIANTKISELEGYADSLSDSMQLYRVNRTIDSIKYYKYLLSLNYKDLVNMRPASKSEQSTYLSQKEKIILKLKYFHSTIM